MHCRLAADVHVGRRACVPLCSCTQYITCRRWVLTPSQCRQASGPECSMVRGGTGAAGAMPASMPVEASKVCAAGLEAARLTQLH